jgi:hypothetical protein
MGTIRQLHPGNNFFSVWVPLVSQGVCATGQVVLSNNK